MADDAKDDKSKVDLEGLYKDLRDKQGDLKYAKADLREAERPPIDEEGAEKAKNKIEALKIDIGFIEREIKEAGGDPKKAGKGGGFITVTTSGGKGDKKKPKSSGGGSGLGGLFKGGGGSSGGGSDAALTKGRIIAWSVVIILALTVAFVTWNPIYGAMVFAIGFGILKAWTKRKEKRWAKIVIITLVVVLLGLVYIYFTETTAGQTFIYGAEDIGVGSAGGLSGLWDKAKIWFGWEYEESYTTEQVDTSGLKASIQITAGSDHVFNEDEFIDILVSLNTTVSDPEKLLDVDDVDVAVSAEWDDEVFIQEWDCDPPRDANDAVFCYYPKDKTKTLEDDDLEDLLSSQQVQSSRPFRAIVVIDYNFAVSSLRKLFFSDGIKTIPESNKYSKQELDGSTGGPITLTVGSNHENIRNTVAVGSRGAKVQVTFKNDEPGVALLKTLTINIPALAGLNVDCPGGYIESRGGGFIICERDYGSKRVKEEESVTVILTFDRGKEHTATIDAKATYDYRLKKAKTINIKYQE